MRSTSRSSPTGSRPIRSTPSTSGGCDVGELLSGAQILCRVLVEEGVDTIWGYPGGAIMPFYHALPDVPELADRMREAIAIAREGRPGPVLIDVPKDVQNQKTEYQESGVRAQGSG